MPRPQTIAIATLVTLLAGAATAEAQVDLLAGVRVERVRQLLVRAGDTGQGGLVAAVARDGLAVGRAVDGVTFSVNRGERFGMVGESGCGKTTTAMTILRLLREPARVVEGRILLDGVDLLRLSDADLRRVRWRRVSLVSTVAPSRRDSFRAKARNFRAGSSRSASAMPISCGGPDKRRRFAVS